MQTCSKGDYFPHVQLLSTIPIAPMATAADSRAAAGSVFILLYFCVWKMLIFVSFISGNMTNSCSHEGEVDGIGLRLE